MEKFMKIVDLIVVTRVISIILLLIMLLTHWN